MTGAPERMDDESGLVLKSIVFLLVFLVVGGIAVADGGSIIVAKFKVANAAQAASEDAAFAYKNSHNEAQARSAALADLTAPERITSFTIDPSTGDVTVTVVVRKVSTIAVKFIGFLKGFERAEATHTAQPPVE